MQPGRRTVCGVLTGALATVLRRPVALTVAGRTDAGVHATGQVAHVDLARALDPEWLVRRLARLLPSDVRVRAITPCPPRSTRGSRRCDATTATGWRPPRPAPSRCAPATRCPGRYPVDLDAVNAASAMLIGEHDFVAFCKRRDGATTVRELQRLSWTLWQDEVVTAAVTADAFCHSMVRSLVGALLDVGRGRRAVVLPAELLRRGGARCRGARGARARPDAGRRRLSAP